ncbi:extracellular solute-binding protein [Candidatus Pseudothioglobus sp. Uisw_041]|jgi:ABC-type glycerol-3-phosphate transport system substrate-binding protein|uniref:ABC transporter substrate-binding protein n=1 Tax=Candidatus Pseudothioglobus sp. Uisw_041 TaxID=3230996 RepID=UPI0023026D8A|nr:extracellular solute-binding protein [Candidatus Thioglobus sp.]MDA8876554.1 extracellular solute-binding protein [Candidatus Thioglobus sp.]MDA9060256.1 extracellular solute-binding protein [Candidatus Thioglobus sp.]MDB4025882.1 extracellular solute-binding protein [Candidatus Thioglobus sp.]MDB4057746.1 extracellular solute-binding protein [Candidatus Thioglobus sp.]
MFLRKIATVVALTTLASSAWAGCGISEGRVSIVGNEFPAIQTIGAGAMECAGGGVTVETNLTADHQKINLPGMTGNPAEFTSAIVANSSIVALMNNDVIRPLNDLVAKHGQGLQKSQLVTIDGNIMGIAFMANAQHLTYRSDVLKDLGIPVPSTYEEMLAAAKKIANYNLMQYPIGGAYAAGWNLAEEFVNMYMGYGGEFFKPGTAEIAVNNQHGVDSLNMMKALSEYMNPDFLTHDSNATSAEWKAGNVALMNMWGSRIGALKGDEVDAAVVAATATAGPMTVGGGTTAASTLWWDGFTVAKNISDTDAEATFMAMMHAIRPAMLNETTSPQAVWLIDGYEPTPAAAGVFAAAAMGTKPYPMLPYAGLMHSAAGAELVDFMQGKETAKEALAGLEAAYTTAATEKGYL